MSASVNPLLYRVLYRRRLRRRTWLAGGLWALFGGLHIAVWWAAFNSGGTAGIWQTGVFQLAVWPLLLAASASFVAMVVYGLRWIYAPRNPDQFDWLEGNQGPSAAVDGPDVIDDPTRSAVFSVNG